MAKKHITLIEDEKILANLVALQLEKEGYEVTVFSDGKEGLRSIVESEPDLVLLDIMLPSMTGMEILEELHARQVTPRLPVIILSNSGQPVEIERVRHLGVRDYLVKVNFTPQEVLQKVRKVFEGGESVPGEGRAAEDKKNTPCILLVEDDSILADALEQKFLQKNYGTQRAANANEARRLLQETKFSMVLLDLVLPDVNGFDFLAEMKQDARYKDIPVVIISNLGQREEVRKGIEMGALDYIIKVNTIPGEIVTKVERLLQRK